jgi:GNAT superfamily N-acetyltransferase
MKTKIRKAALKDNEAIFKFIHDLENQVLDYQLYAGPEFRKMHVGQALLQYAMNLSKLGGINQIEYVPIKSELMRKNFYSTNGFVESHYKYIQ